MTLIVAEVGEAIRQPVRAIEKSGKQWLSFNVQEDLLHGLAVGTTVNIVRQGARETTPAIVTEVLPLGPFATWQPERAVGDHDRNTLRLRIDLVGERTKFEPGMPVWISRRVRRWPGRPFAAGCAMFGRHTGSFSSMARSA